MKLTTDEHVCVWCAYVSVQLAEEYYQHRTINTVKIGFIEQLLFEFYFLSFCFFFCVDPKIQYVYAEMHSHMHTCWFFMTADMLYWLGAEQELYFTAKRYVSHFLCLFGNSSSEIYLRKMQTNNSNNFKLTLSVAKHPSNETDVKLNVKNCLNTALTHQLLNIC